MKSLGMKIRQFNRRFIEKRYRKRIKNTSCSIIAQNCVGGVIYSALGMEFKSPTINVYIEDENFVKLVENLEYYMSLPAEPKIEKFAASPDGKIVFPKIAVGDIEICCMHYHSCQEAIDAWERRKKRVDLNNVCVIANEWNLHGNQSYIERLCQTKYKTIIFTLREYPYEQCLKLKGDFWKEDERGMVRPNLTDYYGLTGYRYFEKQFDFVSWLNK